MINNPKYILVHCSAVSYKTAYDQFKATNIFHRDERRFSMSSLGLYIGYQYFITGGQEYQCRLDTDEGAHCNQGFDGTTVYQPGPSDNPHLGWPAGLSSMNFMSLGVCVGFDGDTEDMPDWAYKLLQERVWAWQDKYAIPDSNVLFHRKFNVNKTCPGSHMTDEWLATLLKRPVAEPPVISPPIVSTSTPQSDILPKVSFFQMILDFLLILFKNMQPTKYRKFGAFTSSEYPDELASRVKAVILGASTIIIWAVAKFFDITLTSDDIMSLGTAISTIVASTWFVYGLAKSTVIWAIEKWSSRITTTV